MSDRRDRELNFKDFLLKYNIYIKYRVKRRGSLGFLHLKLHLKDRLIFIKPYMF